MQSKKKSERIHAHRNALLRYGISYGQKMRKGLIEKIQRGEAIFLESTSNRARNFAVSYEGEVYPVVYDKQRKEIVTFLPREYLDKYQGILEEYQR